MIREFKYEDILKVNELLSIFDYKIEEKSFDNDFLKILIYEDTSIRGVLVYQDLGNILSIDYIVVDEEYRNLGIATKLLNEMENRHKTVDNTTLEVRKSNIVALNFYKKNGFREVAIRKNYYKDEDGILMIKEYR